MNTKHLLLIILMSASALLPARSQTVADAQKQALAKYPDIGRVGSPLHTQFMSLYTAAKQSDPTLLSDPNWPLILADRASTAVLKTRASHPAPAPVPRVVFIPPDRDINVELESTPIEGRATWVMRRTATYFMTYKGQPPTIMPEVSLYLKADPPLAGSAPLSKPIRLRIGDDEIGKATGFLKKFQDWIQVAKKNNVKETRKTIGTLDGAISTREFLFDVHGDETSTHYSLLILFDKQTLEVTDVSAILELFGKWRSVEALLKDKVLHFDRPEKDPLFK